MKNEISPLSENMAVPNLRTFIERTALEMDDDIGSAQNTRKQRL